MEKILKCMLLLLLPSLIVACSTAKKANNIQVDELLNKIKEIEYVHRVEAGIRGYSMNIDIYVESELTRDNSFGVLGLAKEYLDANTVTELTVEFGYENKYPPDTNVYIRDMSGHIRFSFMGSCYESYKRGIPPDCEQYQWREEVE